MFIRPYIKTQLLQVILTLPLREGQGRRCIVVVVIAGIHSRPAMNPSEIKSYRNVLQNIHNHEKMQTIIAVEWLRAALMLPLATPSATPTTRFGSHILLVVH